MRQGGRNSVLELLSVLVLVAGCRASSSAEPGETGGTDGGTDAVVGQDAGTSGGNGTDDASGPGQDAGMAADGDADGDADGASGTGSDGGSLDGSVTPVSVHGQLGIDGNTLVDQNGKTVTLHGMSMYPWNQKGLQFYNASAVGHLAKDWEATVLRIPILPASVASQTPLVETVVKACIANGIYAIIDWHCEGACEAGPASTFFASMATEFGNTPNVIYETWNEPTTQTWATVEAYHETVIAAIRAVDPDNVILCGEPQWDQVPQEAAASPITTSKNIGYTFHFYAASHPLATFGPNVTKALNLGAAIFVSEYGTCKASGNGTFDPTETQLWWNFLDANNISSANWSVETNGETAAALNASASATGPWSAADLTESGTLVTQYLQSMYAATVAP
jgi:endoglucanase